MALVSCFSETLNQNPEFVKLKYFTKQEQVSLTVTVTFVVFTDNFLPLHTLHCSFVHGHCVTTSFTLYL